MVKKNLNEHKHIIVCLNCWQLLLLIFNQNGVYSLFLHNKRCTQTNPCLGWQKLLCYDFEYHKFEIKLLLHII